MIPSAMSVTNKFTINKLIVVRLDCHLFQMIAIVKTLTKHISNEPMMKIDAKSKADIGKVCDTVLLTVTVEWVDGCSDIFMLLKLARNSKTSLLKHLELLRCDLQTC